MDKASSIRMALVALLALCFGASCKTPVGLVFVVENPAAMPSGTASIEVVLSVAGQPYDTVRFAVPATPTPHRYGLRLPDNTSGNVSLTLIPRDGAGDTFPGKCGGEFRWEKGVDLISDINEFTVAFKLVGAQYTNRDELQAIWAANEVWAAGVKGTVLRYEEGCWLKESSLLFKPEYTFKAIWGVPDKELWLAAESSATSPPTVALLARLNGQWELRGEYQGTVTAISGTLASPTLSEKIYMIGTNIIGQPALFHHQRSSTVMAIDQPDAPQICKLENNEVVDKFTALWSRGSEVLVGAATQLDTMPSTMIFRRDATSGMAGMEQFLKIPITVQSGANSTFTYDALGSVATGSKLWAAGAKRAAPPTSSNQVTINIFNDPTGMFAYTKFNFPDHNLFEKNQIQMAVANSGLSYLTKSDRTTLVESPIVRCSHDASAVCSGLANQTGHFHGSVLGMFGKDGGEVWYTTTQGGIVHQRPDESLESFFAP
jgi:hypothetical protein